MPGAVSRKLTISLSNPPPVRPHRRGGRGFKSLTTLGSVDVGVGIVFAAASGAAMSAAPADHQRGRGGNRAAAATGYTIAHAGRQVRFGPVAFWIVVGTFVIMAGWSVTTATYFAFRDDVLKA